ncbi:hypothetical protein NDA03_05125 [Trichocoleus sp. Lan]|uniref:hypothetical protein n=1 Tax=Trichocoleus sp. Lan TaxID=2933927 RepID=UPI00329A7003
MPNQAREPNQEVGASQQAQVFAFSDAGGSAVLDANIAAGVSTNPEGETIAHPIASNFSSTTRTTGDAKTAGAATIAGSYAADGEQSEKGRVNLHNNPDVPGSDAQGTLPDTDPIQLPLDPEVNHPE